MKLRSITCIFCICMFVLSSCNDDREDSNHANRTQANFTAGITTRAVDAVWDVNDVIGINMLDAGGSTILDNAFNRSYYTSTASGNFLPSTSSDMIYFPQNGDEVLFKAYYPYLSTLGRDLNIPVSVSDQRNLPAIDLMTADHLSGFTKDDPNVSLRFYHRLTKMEFRLSVANDVDLSLEDVDLTIKGMKTTGVYNLFTETLTVNDSSTEDILISPESNLSTRMGIVLPRTAGPGVSFELTSTGGSHFSAEMGDELELKPGFKYIFNLSLEGSALTISVTIEDWTDGPTTSYDIFGVTTPAGESVGVYPGDQMQIYAKENNEYRPFNVFTYGEDGRWTTNNPVFWEDIEQNPLELRASLVLREPAKNDTQLPDYILADELSVTPFTGANFVFRHVGSRVKVVLRSNVFSQEQLDAATILLPSYLTGGSELQGEFIPGTTRGDILVDRSAPDDNFAIIQPQPVSQNGSVVRVTIDGRNFTAVATEGAVLYEAGVAYELVVLVNESEVSVSARVVDWVDGPTTTYDTLGVTTPVDASSGVVPGDQMQVYVKENNVYQAFRVFTYGGDGIWTTTNPVFWDNVSSDALDLRAALVPREPAKNETQIPDIMVAEEVTVPRNSGANFVFNHVGSRVRVVLRSNVFTQEQLAAAPIVLPSYILGGREELGVFIPGTSRGDVIVDKSDPNDQFAIIQPQPISPGGGLVTVTIDGRDFTADATDEGFLYEAGVAYEMIILVNESDVSVSARVIDWEEGPTTTYDTLGVTTPVDDSMGVVTGDQMQVYVKEDNQYQPFRLFTYGAGGIWTTPNPVYWDTVLSDQLDLRAALLPREPAKNSTQLPDIIIAEELSVYRNTGANFIFRHAGSRVKVVLRSNVFTPQQLNSASIVLPSYFVGGRESMGEFIPGTTRDDILVDRSDPTDQFAIIQPQAVSPGGDLVRITMDGRNFTAHPESDGFTYEAGVSYEFIITVNETDVSVSARVVDWTPSGPHNFSIFEVTPTMEDTEGVEVGARMNVYINEDNQYNIWTTFTYAGANIWRPDADVYWEEITGDYADLRASIIAEPQLHPSQIDDILIASELRVPIYQGADFVFRHAGSRAVVALVSDTYSETELNSATIFMPQYFTGGYEDAGRFVAGQTREDITLVRDVDTNNGVAIIQPQTVAAGNNLFRIRIGTRDYWAKAPEGGFTYEPGVSYAITIYLNEENLTVSAQIIPWTTTEVNLNAFTLDVTLPGTSTGVDNGTQMNVYMAEGTGRDLLSTFTYNLAGDSWISSPKIYWDNLPTPIPAFYASILVDEKLDPTQLDDYLIADPVAPVFGEPVDFTLRHPASKVVIQLRSDSTFVPEDLAKMVITLPDYIIGGEHNNGIFEFPQNNPVGTINVPVINNNATAIIRPQTVTNRTIVNIYDPTTNRNYPVTSDMSIEFLPGDAKTLIINMSKTGITVSANAIAWETGLTIPLVAPSIEITGSIGNTSEFFEDKTIYAYKLGDNFRELVYHYEPDGTGGHEWRGTQTLYWDNLNGDPLTITGVYYPQQALIPDNLSQTQTFFPLEVSPNQSSGYDQYDLLMSSLYVPTPAPVNFNFKHVLSKVRVALVAPEFTAEELDGMTVTLNGFILDGTASLTSGSVTGNGTRKNIIPYTDTVNQNYSALVMPQTIQSGRTVVTITLPGYENVPFEGKLTSNLSFIAGQETVITVTLTKTAIEIAATLEPWTNGPEGSITIQ